VEWINDARTKRFVVPAAPWYVMRTKVPPHGFNLTSWNSFLDLEGGERHSFVLYTTDTEGHVCIRSANGALIGILDEGHWEARLAVTSDTERGFEGTLYFTVSRYRGILPDSPASVPMEPYAVRKLPPNLPQR
jgi:hypothetical protein